MKKNLLFLLLSVLWIVSSFQLKAQEQKKPGANPPEREYIDGLPVLSDADLARFKSLPEATIPDFLRGRELPAVVDNSQLPYFRPIFNQSSLECGQASGVGYTFTYEMDRMRDLPANVPENQYPTHFVFNWSNNGSGSACPFFDSWDILKQVGTPNVSDYGGALNTGGTSRWMSGYDKYYNAMHNRIWDYYMIKLDDVEGLNTLRHWIADHLEGAETGGTANFYASYQGVNKTLPAGTPEAGKHVLTELGTYANHALCVVGYHDSIRYDINNDGQYTNDIDINNDGVVNIRDWEIGGVKLANSYSATSWGDEGFAYLLYSGLCQTLAQSGVWNGAVHIIKAKENTDPQLTYKVTLTHTVRNEIKVMAGVATTPNATEPEYIIEFPILNYQGGAKYMQGGTSEDDKTLEFGLDVTPLLSYIDSSSEATFFLLVNEKDASGNGEGLVDQFSVMDYTGSSPVEIPCPQSNVELTNNGLTTLSVNATVNFEVPSIINEELPPATINEPYSNQMIASGGTEPFQWKIRQHYSVDDGTSQFPMVSQQQLYPSGSTSGYAEKELGFEFPFYGSNYDKVYIHTDGYLMFRDDNYPWTFLVDQFNLFRNMRNISPFMSKTLGVSGGGMWYEGDAQKATFRWKAIEYSTNNELNFAVTLYPSGKIEFYYGDITCASWNPYFIGVSDGNDLNYDLLDISNTYNFVPNTVYTLEPDYSFTEMNITEDGLFQGTPTVPYEAVDVQFLAKDANGMQQTKTLPFYTDGINSIVIRGVTATSGGDNIIENGETAVISVELKNIGDEPVDATQMTISSDDPYITVVDDTESLGTFEPGETVVLEDAFSFEVSQQVPDNYDLILATAIDAQPDVFNSHIYLKAYAPDLAIGTVSFDDGNNGYIEPGETVQVLVNVLNMGGGKATNVTAQLENYDPFIEITQGSTDLGDLPGNQSAQAVFEITVDESTPIGYTTSMNITAQADYGYTVSDNIVASVGFVVEDFESGGFENFDWEFAGDAPWIIDEQDPYEGQYAIRSGDVEDDQSSTVFASLDVLADGEISFYYKVSSEDTYDFLRFYIDGSEVMSWAGEQGWAQFTAPVSAGQHTFKWSYEKDYSVSNGSDCGWIDYIVFPPSASSALVVSAGPDMNICENESPVINAVIVNALTVNWTTSGDGTYDDPTLVNPVYTPGTGDIESGSVTLTVTAEDIAGNIITDEMVLSIAHLPIVWAGDDTSMCESTTMVELDGTMVNTDVCEWTTSGDGYFENPEAPATSYWPGTEDYAGGQVTLTLTGFSVAPCVDEVNASLQVVFWSLPEVTFDTLPDFCLTSPVYELTEGHPAGGVYEGPGVDNGWFDPVAAGLGTHQISYSYTDGNGCTNLALQSVKVEDCTGIGTPAISNLQVYPNPGSGMFTLQLPEQAAGGSVSIFNINGKKIWYHEFNSITKTRDLSIDLTGQPAGVYYMKFTSEDLSGNTKLVIQK